MSSGIYKITIGKWFYYGQTTSFNRRRREHIVRLKQGKHPNSILQNAYNKYKTFEFQECAYEKDSDLLTELEQLVIDEWFGKPNCANLNPEASVPPSTKGKKRGPLTEETKAKMSAARKGKKRSPLTEETKAKISAAKKNHKCSEEAKAKISAANKSRVSHNKGIPHSEETKARMSAAQKLYHERKRQENLE